LNVDELTEYDEPSLSSVDERPVTCEERLKAAEVQLMLNRTNADQVKQHQLAYDQAVQDIKVLKARIQALENEIDAVRRASQHNINAMAEYLSLIEHLDFKVESKRLKYIIAVNDHFYLRFDKNGQIIHAYAPEEYNAVIKREWDELNAG